MSTGLILLVFIGAIVAFCLDALRGKMKLSVVGQALDWGRSSSLVLVLLMLWASVRCTAGHLTTGRRR